LGISISATDIEQFRTGHFQAHTEEVKSLWITCMLTLLPKISTKYKARVQKSARVSTIATDSDEAFLLWILTLYGSEWSLRTEHDGNEGVENFQGNGGSGGRKKRIYEKTGQQHSRTQIKLYTKLKNLVKQQRSDPVTGTAWDDALKVAAVKQYSRDAQNTSIGTHQQQDQLSDFDDLDLDIDELDDDFIQHLPTLREAV
jgi:hypothetical protein